MCMLVLISLALGYKETQKIGRINMDIAELSPNGGGGIAESGNPNGVGGWVCGRDSSN